MVVTRSFNPRLFLALAFLTIMSAIMASLVRYQPVGIDLLPMWTGGRVAVLEGVGRLYDVGYISDLQGWPIGPDKIRPFLYPPTTLLIFTPLSFVPWPLAYALWIAATGGLYAWAGRRAGAPLWFLLAPWVVFAAFCGQVTLLIGGLVAFGLAERASRPVLAGVAFGIAAAIKPQLLVFLPVALAAEGRWRVFLATGVTGLALCAAASLLFGVQVWVDWLGSIAQFSELAMQDPLMTRNMVTPAAALHGAGVDARWALALIPAAGAAVWFAFRRRRSFPVQLIVLFGAALAVSPYAMNYELALFAPAIAIYLGRTNDPRWIWTLAVVTVIAITIHPALVNLLAVMALPFTTRQRDQHFAPAVAGSTVAGGERASP